MPLRRRESNGSPAQNSAAHLELLEDALLDVIVVGGGIVGAGVARDAAMRGLNVGLIEQNDFASGTSSRSSRLLHGGMRYLAQGRVGLVWEASREKTILRRIAPHLSSPLEFIFPTRQASGWPRWKLGLGVKLYDLLCGIGQGGGSGSMSVAQTLERLPGLNTERLTGAVRYHDALTNDSRLVLDTIGSAHAHGAIACNYAKLSEASVHADIWHCEVQNTLTGTSHVVRSRAVVNATGPWSDRIPHSRTSLRLTKGVHLVIDGSRLPTDEAVVLAEGNRILFVIPWGERVILGTTDTDYQGPLENPPCDSADVEYILAVVNEAFPDARLLPRDVVSTWSGLRPLVADKRGNPSDISRRHKIAMSEPGWWDVTGGKLTTYRLMAEETVDLIAKFLGVRATQGKTAEAPLTDDRQNTYSGILPPPISQAAVQYYCREEWARRLDDVMIRRTSWRHYYGRQHELAGEVARWMGQELSWSEAQEHSELERYRALVGVGEVPAPHILNGGSRDLNRNGAQSTGHRQAPRHTAISDAASD